MHKIIRSKIVQWLLRGFFSIWYDTKYLHGYFFEDRIAGWRWAWIGVRNRKWRTNNKTPWPVHPNTTVTGAENIVFDLGSMNVFQTPGCYWQAINAKIKIGADCYVAPNVGVVTTNHSVACPSEHTEGKDIIISDHCWIGMNAVILPGVTLGENTVVAAGAVVTHSFPEGHCTVAGVPAKIVKKR